MDKLGFQKITITQIHLY